MNNLPIENKLYEEIKQKHNLMAQERGLPDVELDQYFINQETCIKRALIINPEQYDGKRIILLGDMDLVALSIGLISNPRDLAVLDIDKRIPELVFKMKFDHKIRTIRYVNHDIRIRMIAVLKNQFDFIFIEPPMTPEGLELGLSRAIQNAKKDVQSKIFLSFDIEDKRKDIIQNLIERMNLELETFIPNFNKYDYDTPLNKKTSDMYILNVKSDSKETIEHHYLGPTYYRESNTFPQQYRCKCGEIYLIGEEEDFSSIEELIAKGCPKCDYKDVFLYSSSIKIE